MIADHLVEVERRLPMALAWPATASGLFERDFCEPMFGAEMQIAAPGRIVDGSSTASSPPVAADVLLCLRHGPRLRQYGQPDVFLAESVLAAITVLPSIDSESMSRAVASAKLVKSLRRSGLHPASSGPLDGRSGPLATDLSDAARAIPCHVVAFAGPPEMQEVHRWLKLAYRDQGISEADMPTTGAEREQIASPALDGVFVLGRGYLAFDNSPLGLIDDHARRGSFGACWAIATAECGSLLALFLQLQLAAIAMADTRLDPRPYLSGPASQISSLRLGN